jgi:hypothetical protein
LERLGREGGNPQRVAVPNGGDDDDDDDMSVSLSLSIYNVKVRF